jgi:uncharacterized protein (TIGR02466 family)
MIENHTILPLFSKVFYLKILEDLPLNKIIEIIKKEKYKNSGEINEELNVNNISSISHNRNILETKKFTFLKKILLKEFNTFKNNVLNYTKNNFEITTSWIALSNKEQKSNLHNHQNCMYSGILYLQTDANSGDIIFDDMRDTRLKLYCNSYNMYNSKSWKITPTNGMLIFFPSEVHHQILKNNSNIERYSLAFNLMPTGKIGIENSDSFVNLKILK